MTDHDIWFKLYEDALDDGLPSILAASAADDGLTDILAARIDDAGYQREER